MLLVVDAGNTNVVFGVYDGDILVATWRMATQQNKTADEIGAFLLELMRRWNIEKEQIDDIIIASVVPSIMYPLEHCMRKYLEKNVIVVDETMDLGIHIQLDNSKEVGADRLVNAAVAYELYGGPLIIIDFGTATTFCAVDSHGNYLGGAICPGIKVSVNALYQNAAKLPLIELVQPQEVIGRNTVAAMQSGVILGYTGQVEYLTRKFKEQIGEAKVIATGGLARMIASDTNAIDVVDPQLTLKGLHLLYQKNAAK